MIINSMHEAEKRGADSLKLQRERILCAAQSGQMSIAGRHLASLLTASDYDNKDVCRAYIAGFLRVQKLNEATQLIESLILDSPDDPWPWIVKGRISLLRSDLSKAESSFREACRRDSANMEAVVFLAEVLKDSRQIDEAIPYFRKAMTDQKQHLRAAIGLSKCLTSSGHPEEAIKLLKETIAMYPEDAIVLLELGRSQFEDGDYSTASVTLEKTVSLRPWSDEGHYLLAQCLQASDRREEAKPHFEFVKSAKEAHSELNGLQDRLSKSPTDDKLLLRIGVLLSQFGDPQEAVEVLRSAIDLNPQNLEARNLLAELRGKQASNDPVPSNPAVFPGATPAP
jgi:tetratricopeptide (TPR) repeat protein